jgi:hypothetical protein
MQMSWERQKRELRLLAVLSAGACGVSMAMGAQVFSAIFATFTVISIVETKRLR